MNIVISRTMLAIEPGGSEFVLTLAIGAPSKVPNSDWACLVQATRLFDEPRPIHGLDSWQAVQLSYQFIISLVEGFVDRGGTLFWPESRESISVHDLLPSLP